MHFGLRSTARKSGSEHPLDWLTDRSCGYELYDGNLSEEIMSDIRRAVAMAHQRPPVSLSVREAMLTLILGQLVEHSRVQASTAQPIAGEFQQLIRWMTSKLHEQVTIKEMAEFTGYSASHFRSRFVKEVGCPPGNFLRHVRHMEAGRLLRETQKPIKTIALQVGYEDPSHFYRFFTGLSGLTPLAYRERYQLRG